MATKTKTKPRKKAKAESNGHVPRAKQGRLEGMEEASVPEIDTLADSFLAARNKWQKAHAPMEEAHAMLQDAMHRHGLKVYRYDDHEVLLVGKERVKVKTASEDGGDE